MSDRKINDDEDTIKNDFKVLSNVQVLADSNAKHDISKEKISEEEKNINKTLERIPSASFEASNKLRTMLCTQGEIFSENNMQVFDQDYCKEKHNNVQETKTSSPPFTQLVEQMHENSKHELETNYEEACAYKDVNSNTGTIDVNAMENEKETAFDDLNCQNRSEARHKNQNIKALTSADFTGNTNGVENFDNNMRNDKFLESLKTQEEGNERYCADEEKSSTSYMPGGLRQSFNENSQIFTKDESKRGNVKNVSLVKKEQHEEMQGKELEQSSDLSDKYTSSQCNAISLELEVNNRHRQRHSAANLSDQQQKHNFEGFIAISKIEMNEKRNISNLSTNNRIDNATISKFISNNISEEDGVCSLQVGHKYLDESNAFPSQRLTPMSTTPNSSKTAESSSILTKYSIDEKHDSQIEEQLNGSSCGDRTVSDSFEGSSDSARPWVDELLNPSILISSLDLPFTSVYIDPKRRPLFSYENCKPFYRSGIIQQSCNPTDITSTDLGNLVSHDKLKSSLRTISMSQSLRGADYRLSRNRNAYKYNVPDCPLVNPNSVERSDLFFNEANTKVNVPQIPDDKYTYTHQGVKHKRNKTAETVCFEQFETQPFHNKVVFKTKHRRPFQLEDIQEVKSQDERSSLADVRL